MKRGVAILFLMPLLLAFARPCAGQFSRFGLGGRTVFDLALFRGSIYAATDTGVYVTTPPYPDSRWSLVGLAGKRVRSIHPHDVGPLSWTVTAGLEVAYDDTTTSRTWCLNPGTQQWDPTDDGMCRTDISSIHALDGFPSPAICGETFAGGQGKVYRHTASGGSWDLVLDIGIGQVNAIGTAGNMVMAGGETAIFAPFIARSFDKGETWETAFPDMAGDNACDGLAFGRAGVIYAGMEGAVIQSMDSGATWTSAGLAGTPYYFFGLAADSVDNTIFAGGITLTGKWGLYVLNSGQESWVRLDPPWTVRGIRSLALATDYPLGIQTVFIGTDEDGVLLYQQPVVSVEDNGEPPASFECGSYPNPFNGQAVISVRMPSAGSTIVNAVGSASGGSNGSMPGRAGSTGVGGAVGTVANRGTRSGPAGAAWGTEPDGHHLTINVYDLLGRCVSSVYDGPLGFGVHTFPWRPGGLATGTYICRVSAAGAIRHIKMLYVR